MSNGTVKMLRVVGDVLFSAVMSPLFLAGYLCHKIWKYVSAGFMAGWITSRDMDE